MKRLLSLSLAAMMTISLMSGCSSSSSETASSDEPITLQYAHPVTEDSNTHRLGVKFQEEVERLSDGTMTIQILSNFSDETSLIESVQAGDIAFTLTSAAPIVSFQPKMAVFDVPFLFESKDTPEETMAAVYEIFETEEVAGTLDYLEDVGIHGLGYLGLGFRVLATNKKIDTLDDLSGLKIRVMENTNHLASFSALGANPTPMDYSEVFTAIEQKTIDGQEQPFDILASGKYYEILDYATTIDMIFNTTVFMASSSIYNGLTAEQQAIIDEAAANAVAWAREDAIADVANNINILLEGGMEVNSLSDADRALCIELTQSVEASIRESIGDEIVDIFKDAVAAS